MWSDLAQGHAEIREERADDRKKGRWREPLAPAPRSGHDQSEGVMLT